MRSGEFAKLCGTTKNTLIHYDQLGLLKPSSVGANGYREYSYADTSRFIAISAFADAGFSLRQIKEMLDSADPSLVAKFAKANAEAIQERIDKLERSAALLEEIALQTTGSISEDEVRIDTLPTRTLLVVRTAGVSHPGDDTAAMWADSPDTVKALEMIGGRAQISPYGFTATLNRGEPIYTSAYFLLPENTSINKDAEDFIERTEIMSLSVMTGGKYASIGYDGPWAAIERAYDRLVAFASSKEMSFIGDFFETSSLWLLDTDESLRYRCTISAKINDTA